ncbi:Rrf2 family transcriptional regulator [Acuticoccus sp. MNP-M23]|uniref:Rrf2 family transcriptional regulator n=1 Tax=Acuticoccus sp. MNP-M23 TaxID=3072793 RepID=UPI002814C6F3|nr:Rrf2 family transcriptional regulator [Acuticoccus sp. MNP-M23]WMS44463.1 Rrf2 family transcriptional regulator [Acuticoccus sp. MNP-M23]
MLAILSETVTQDEMRLTEQTRYALRVLAYCAKFHPEITSVKTVAADTGLTEFTIFKLLKSATKAGLVTSVRGRNGGIRLAAPPGELALGAVVRVFEPRFQRCGPAKLMASHELKSDAVDRKLNQALGMGFAAFLDTLDAMTVEDLLTEDPVAPFFAIDDRPAPTQLMMRG